MKRIKPKKTIGGKLLVSTRQWGEIEREAHLLEVKNRALEQELNGYREMHARSQENERKNLQLLEEQHREEIFRLQTRLDAVLYSLVLMQRVVQGGHKELKAEREKVRKVMEGDSLSLAVPDAEQATTSAYRDLQEKRAAYLDAKMKAYAENYGMGKPRLNKLGIPFGPRLSPINPPIVCGTGR